MSRTSTGTILDTGDLFPALEFPLAGGGKFSFCRDLGDRWTILLFYRGHW